MQKLFFFIFWLKGKFITSKGCKDGRNFPVLLPSGRRQKASLLLPDSLMNCVAVYGTYPGVKFSAQHRQNEGPATVNRYSIINSCSFSTAASCLCPSLMYHIAGGMMEVRLGIRRTMMSTLEETLGPTLETRTI